MLSHATLADNNKEHAVRCISDQHDMAPYLQKEESI